MLVRAVLDALGIDDAIVTGHSMGGGIALELARMEPRRVRSLVLVACALDLRISQAIRTLLHDRFALAARTISAASVSPRAATAAGLDSLAASFWHASPAIVRQDFDACDAFDFTNHAHALRGPAFIVAGADDALIPTERCRRLAGAIPGGELDIVADAGHLVPIEQPAAIVRAIRRTGL